MYKKLLRLWLGFVIVSALAHLATGLISSHELPGFDAVQLGNSFFDILVAGLVIWVIAYPASRWEYLLCIALTLTSAILSVRHGLLGSFESGGAILHWIASAGNFVGSVFGAFVVTKFRRMPWRET